MQHARRPAPPSLNEQITVILFDWVYREYNTTSRNPDTGKLELSDLRRSIDRLTAEKASPETINSVLRAHIVGDMERTLGTDTVWTRIGETAIGLADFSAISESLVRLNTAHEAAVERSVRKRMSFVDLVTRGRSSEQGLA